jgi:hypothetical protein
VEEIVEVAEEETVEEIEVEIVVAQEEVDRWISDLQHLLFLMELIFIVHKIALL